MSFKEYFNCRNYSPEFSPFYAYFFGKKKSLRGIVDDMLKCLHPHTPERQLEEFSPTSLRNNKTTEMTLLVFFKKKIYLYFLFLFSKINNPLVVL
jgi:hypothetical protein